MVLFMEGISIFSWMELRSISSSRLGVWCFIGVVNNLAIKLTNNFVEKIERSLAVIRIIFGIFTVAEDLAVFFVIMIKLRARYNNM